MPALEVGLRFRSLSVFDLALPLRNRPASVRQNAVETWAVRGKTRVAVFSAPELGAGPTRAELRDALHGQELLRDSDEQGDRHAPRPERLRPVRRR